MKRKYAIAVVTAAAAVFTTAAVRPGTFPAKDLRVFFLRSQGKTIAELRVAAGTSCEVQSLSPSGWSEFYQSAGVIKASNGALLKIISGTNSVTVTADEIEGRPEAEQK
jgi:hypothetical protein